MPAIASASWRSFPATWAGWPPSGTESAGSCMGRPLPGDRPLSQLRRQLTHLEQAGLIQPAVGLPELAYQFRHALIQDSAYRTLVRADRRQVHQAAGEALEALLAGTEPSPELAPQ